MDLNLEKDLNIFDNAIGSSTSDDNWRVNKDKSIPHSYHYLPITDNLHLDSWGFIQRSKYVFLYPHVINVRSVSKSFLATYVLEPLRKFIIDRTSNEKYSVDYITFVKSIPDDFVIKVSGLFIDPGVHEHLTPQDKRFGLRIGSLTNYYDSEIFSSDQLHLLEENMSLKQLLLNPKPYYDFLEFNDLTRVNSLLANFSKQVHSPGKIKAQLENYLDSTHHFKMDTITDTQNDRVIHHIDVNITYEYVGHHPQLKFRVHPEYGKIKADLNRDTNFQNDGYFVLHVFIRPSDRIQHELPKENDRNIEDYIVSIVEHHIKTELENRFGIESYSSKHSLGVTQIIFN